MKLFGHDISEEVDGRILAEALKNPENHTEQEPVEITCSSHNKKGAVTHLNVTHFGTTRYLNCAWAE